jgi:hypothetical protein
LRHNSSLNLLGMELGVALGKPLGLRLGTELSTASCIGVAGRSAMRPELGEAFGPELGAALGSRFGMSDNGCIGDWQ